MEKKLSKLQIKDAATVEIINQTESSINQEFEETKQKLSKLKDDASETADCLASINSRIQDHLEKMERLKKLDFNSI